MAKPDDQRLDPAPRVEQLYEQAAPRLRRLARGGERGDAEDLVQASFLRLLHQDGADGDQVRSPLRYLFGIARNLRLDGVRRRARAAVAMQTHELVNLSPVDEADPERNLSAKQQLARAMKAIDELPPRCREAFLLRRFEELSHAEIARRMGISTSMVEKHVADAMRRITTRIETDEPGWP